MPRYIHEVHVADGFVDDCEELMLRCSRHEPLTFQKFTEIWKEMNLAGIYRERRISSEVAELSEEAIYIAKRYMVANTSNYEESVAGLFLVYGLLNLQPFKGFAPLRLVPDDVPAISRIELVARRDRRLDVLYVLGSVLVRGPVQCHAENRPYGFDNSLRKYLNGFTSMDKFGVRPKGVFYRQNEELDIIRDVANLTKHYEEAKSKITDEQGQKDPNLKYADKDLPAKLESSLKKIINGFIEGDGRSEEGSPSNIRTDRIRDIKARAMRGGIQPVRHLTSHRYKKSPTTISPRKQPDIVSKAGKVKSGSPMKPVTTRSPRKRKRAAKKRKPTKKKRKYSSSESSETTIILSDFDDNASDVSNVDDWTNNASEDVGSDSGSYNRLEVEIEDINNMDPEPNIENLVVKEYDVQIETLPIVIKGNSSENFEIEFIDNFIKPAENNNMKNIEEAQTKLNKLPGISITKVVQGSSEETNLLPQLGEEINRMFQMPEKLRKPERRELKQPLLKSKFKRMGLEHLANFENSEKPKTPKNQK